MKQKHSSGLFLGRGLPNPFIIIYILPIQEIKNKSTLNICEKYDKYRVYKNYGGIYENY